MKKKMKSKTNKKFLSASLTVMILISMFVVLSPVMGYESSPAITGDLTVPLSNDQDAYWNGLTVLGDSQSLTATEKTSEDMLSPIKTGATTKECKVGCLKSDRVASGDLEFANGTYYDEAIAELANPGNFGPGGVVDCEFTLLSAIHDITADNLDDMDIFWAGLLLNSDPLTTDEQQVLLDFVKDGGALVIIADAGPNFAIGPNSVAAPFNVHWDNTSWISENPTITETTHPIIAGPFGTVGTIGHASEGSIDSLGPYAEEIVSNVNGVSIAWIEPGKLDANSGHVFLFSDANEFTSNPTPWGPGFDRFDNRILFRNLFAYLCKPEPEIEPYVFTTTDAVIALQIAAGSRPPDLCWDVSGDGSVTSLDALMILQAA